MNRLIQIVLLILLLGARAAHADDTCGAGRELHTYPTASGGQIQSCAAAHCAYGYQDSSCITPLRGSGPPMPQCSTGDGWTTTAAAVWQGSHWSQPTCNHQAPQTCPPGDTETSAPVWNGSSWSGPVCSQPAQSNPTQPTIPQQEQACVNAIDSGMSVATRMLYLPSNLAFTGPFAGQPVESFIDTTYNNNSFSYEFIAGSNVDPADVTSLNTWTSSPGSFAICWTTPGTTMVAGWAVYAVAPGGGTP